MRLIQIDKAMLRRSYDGYGLISDPFPLNVTPLNAVGFTLERHKSIMTYCINIMVYQ